MVLQTGRYFCFIFLLSVIENVTCFANSLTLEISGKINDQCQINLSAGNEIDLSNVKEKSLPMDIYCNQPMNIRVSSVNGGLAIKGREDIEPHIYTLEIDIGDLNLNYKNKSDALTIAKEVKSSGVIPFSTSGTLRVTLEESLLFAGYYEDVVQIDVFPSIHNISAQ